MSSAQVGLSALGAAFSVRSSGCNAKAEYIRDACLCRYGYTHIDPEQSPSPPDDHLQREEVGDGDHQEYRPRSHQICPWSVSEGIKRVRTPEGRKDAVSLLTRRIAL